MFLEKQKIGENNNLEKQDWKERTALILEIGSSETWPEPSRQTRKFGNPGVAKNGKTFGTLFFRKKEHRHFWNKFLPETTKVSNLEYTVQVSKYVCLHLQIGQNISRQTKGGLDVQDTKQHFRNTGGISISLTTFSEYLLNSKIFSFIWETLAESGIIFGILPESWSLPTNFGNISVILDSAAPCSQHWQNWSSSNRFSETIGRNQMLA